MLFSPTAYDSQRLCFIGHEVLCWKTPARRAVLATLQFSDRALTISMGIARLLGATAIGATAAPHHILCLHGGGTNAAIMRLQTSKLRHQLRDVAGMPHRARTKD